MGVEGFTRAAVDMATSGPGKFDSYKDMLASILSLVLSIVIIAFVGKFLWNETVADLFTFARPVKSVWQIIGLMILLRLFV
jgi:hypothetical protein